MRKEQENICHLRESFIKMQSKTDLLYLLNDAQNILYDKKCIPIILKSLNYYANPSFSRNQRYCSFTIRKKSGGNRLINSPKKGLKRILRPLNLILQSVFEPHMDATGFIPGKSIVDNAKLHTGNHYVYNVDLKDFFHSFSRNQVKMALMLNPSGLGKEREFLAFVIASLCTHPFEIDGKIESVLPQGSPTSPTLTNILCIDLDRRLKGLANRFGVKYSRYADDITFSSPHNIYNMKSFQNELYRIIENNQGLKINSKKSRLQNALIRQEVTGLTVNKKVNVKTRYVKNIRMWLYYWEKYGYEKAEQLFLNDYKVDKGYVKKGNPNFVNVISGKLEFLKMVRGKDDSLCNKLEARFFKLLDEMHEIPNITKIIDVWEKEGVEKAIDLYYQKKV